MWSCHRTFLLGRADGSGCVQPYIVIRHNCQKACIVKTCTVLDQPIPQSFGDATCKLARTCMECAPGFYCMLYKCIFVRCSAIKRNLRSCWNIDMLWSFRELVSVICGVVLGVGIEGYMWTRRPTGRGCRPSLTLLRLKLVMIAGCAIEWDLWARWRWRSVLTSGRLMCWVVRNVCCCGIKVATTVCTHWLSIHVTKMNYTRQPVAMQAAADKILEGVLPPKMVMSHNVLWTKTPRGTAHMAVAALQLVSAPQSHVLYTHPHTLLCHRMVGLAWTVAFDNATFQVKSFLCTYPTHRL